MLHNPNWDKPTGDLMSPETLLAWLEKKPALHTYAYRAGDSCLLAQYFRENGEPRVIIGHSTKWNGGKTVALPLSFQVAAGRTSIDHTFGGALKRLKAHMKKETADAV